MVSKQVLDSIKLPLKPETFERQMASLLKQVPDDKPISLRTLQHCDQTQRELMKEQLAHLRTTYLSTEKQHDSKQRPILINLNLEAMVTLYHQEKLKRDRVGIIFEKAKKSAWDPAHKSYAEAREVQKEVTEQPGLWHNATASTAASAGQGKGAGAPQLEEPTTAAAHETCRKLTLEQDIICSDTEESTAQAARPEQKGEHVDDYNPLYESQINAYERENVRYDDMF